MPDDRDAERRCPACGATNPAAATWCGQCYAALGSANAAPPLARPAPARRHVGGKEADGGAVEGGGAAQLRRSGDRVEWRCPTCGQYSDLDVARCTVCGTAFADRLAQQAEPVSEQQWRLALGLSAVAPGSGHMLVGRVGSGVARAVLFCVWLGGGLIVSGTGAGAGAAAAPLLLGAAAVWAGTLLDVTLARRGDRELLAGRTLLWLVVGVLGLSIIGVVAAAGTGRG